MRRPILLATMLMLFISTVPCRANGNVFISMEGDCRHPAIATEKNDLYMAWIVAGNKKADLFFRRSADEGKNWSTAQKLSNKNSDCYPPALAADSGIVHLAWIDYGETVDGELYYTRSNDGGLTWEKNKILVRDANGACHPSLFSRGYEVYLLWQNVDKKIYFKATRVT